MDKEKWAALEYKTYEAAKEGFHWKERWGLFDGTKETFNIASECIDRHPEKDPAVRIKFSDGKTETYRFGQMSRWTSQYANMLNRLGIGQGERIQFLDEQMLIELSVIMRVPPGAVAEVHVV